ncbi:AN1-type zinc finger protein [Verticillium dahliae VDG1]|nr:AN1-type zinc finger protein [Verticillium dahliae VDG1]
MAIQIPSRITFEGPDTDRKWGDAARLRREVEAMTFVQRETSVPVPTILEVYFDDHSDEYKCWILMERLPGSQLGTAWPEMDDNARSETIRQLRSYLEQIHHLRPAGAGFLVAPVKQSPRPGTFAKCRAQFPDTYEIRFAHADLSWENILVDASTGKITGILD